MCEEYADFALKFLKKNNVQYGEVRLEEHEEEGLILKNGGLEVSGFDHSAGIGIRFLLNNALGFVSINRFEKDSIKRNIINALRTVRKGNRLSEKIRLSEEPVYNKRYNVPQKIKFKDVKLSEKIRLLNETDSEAKNAIGRYLSLSSDIAKKYFLTTEGARIISEIPRANFTFFLTLKIDGKSSQKYWQLCNSGGYEHVKKWDLPRYISDEYKAIEKNLKHAKKPPKEKIDVVVGPEVTGIMVHESVGHPFEADRIFGREAAQAGESFINKEMIGNRIGNEIVNVVDDPTLENSAGHYLFDDEGVKARRRFLIKNGKIDEFLHNRETAAEMNIKSNGAARAEDYDKEAIVRMANTFLLPGDYSEEELIKDIKLGVYIRDFTEWNIDDKRFQQKYVGSDAYLIKDGEVKYPVIKPVLELTTPALWNGIDAIGKNMEYHTGTCGKGEPMQGVPAFLGGPSIRIKNVRLG
ncbi:TldD/PmbA family protein [Candidatus Woesearchaeota archaeon]|nr:TldD/PmbA family protein [Candidatus Woesearchaeota archaeon]